MSTTRGVPWWAAARIGTLTSGYESWFLRANAPDAARAFWISYTAFRDSSTFEGELWFAGFDAEHGVPVTAYVASAAADCRFSADELYVSIPHARLLPQQAVGTMPETDISWQLEFRSSEKPLLLLPENYYHGRFPNAKSLVVNPGAVFSGAVRWGGRQYDVNGWRGSVNHNWGSRHTDRYAWGQVAGFDGAPDVFLECASAKLRLGAFWSPWLSLAVLRIGSEEYRFNRPLETIRSRERVTTQKWTLDCHHGEYVLRAEFHAEPAQTAVFHYRNPGHTDKICRNTKIAACSAKLEKNGRLIGQWHTANRAAFEYLT